MSREGGFGSLDQLWLVDLVEYPLGSLQVLRQHAAHGGSVEAVGAAQLGVPEVGIVEAGGPGESPASPGLMRLDSLLDDRYPAQP